MRFSGLFVAVAVLARAALSSAECDGWSGGIGDGACYQFNNNADCGMCTTAQQSPRQQSVPPVPPNNPSTLESSSKRLLGETCYGAQNISPDCSCQRRHINVLMFIPDGHFIIAFIVSILLRAFHVCHTHACMCRAAKNVFIRFFLAKSYSDDDVCVASSAI